MKDLIEQAIARFDAMNAQDPNKIVILGTERPRELVLAEYLSQWVAKVDPSAHDALVLAARCQHLMRWTVPRSDYPEGRIGYLKWRKDLSKKHADLASEVLQELGFSQTTIEQVRRINLKEGLKTNPDTQTMEDALCLSFLEHEFSDFAEKHPDDKVMDIVQKTWCKMSERAHELALGLPLEGRAKKLVARALA
jgi:hypothetical protein